MTRCPSCDHANRERAKYCESCGERLRQPCPSCGTELRAGGRFCDECGARVEGAAQGATARPGLEGRDPRAYTPRHLANRILSEKSALEGERKQVSVLFVDVKGSQDLASSIDAEDWHRILDRFFSILANGVHRFEGTINQYTGDGIMALFGAPIAHEDHAQRACYAGLHLRDALRRFGDELRRSKGLNFSARMGLNSGEVVVGRIGDDLRMDYTAQGHTVGLAARMEQLAEPGRLYLTENTSELVEGFFELRNLGPFDIDGMHQPVRVYELEGMGQLRTRLDLSRARGFSKFVGREVETGALDDALQQAVSGQGQIIGLVAEPGVGKSRLFYEFAVSCRSKGILVREARAAPHGRSIPFLPLLELLRDYMGIGEGDSDDEVRRKIAGTLVLLGAQLESALPLVFEFLGVPDPERESPTLEPEERRRRFFSVLRALLHARSRKEPAVLIIEDLHWIDSGSEAFLEHLAEDVPKTPTLLLVNYRPEYDGDWRDRSTFTEIELEPLAPDATTELLHHLLGDDPGLRDLRDLIRKRAGGNPFFIEEIVRSLIDGGALIGERGAQILARPVEEIRVPATVQPLLAARIDWLGETAKEVLQTAAVIGPSFNLAVLESISEASDDELFDSLQVLIEGGYIHATSLYPVTEYAFRHPLTHDVAYRSQLFDRRARLHRSVAETLEELSSDQPDDRSALLAHHWEAAGEPLDAARWHARAAIWVEENNPPEAVRHWNQVIALLRGRTESDETRRLALEGRTALLTYGWRFGLPESEAERLFAESQELAEHIEDPALTARVLMSYGQIRTWTTTRDPERALHLSREAVRLAEQTDDPELRAAAYGQLARAYWRVRDYRAALAATEAASQGDPTSNRQVRFRGRVLAEVGRLADAKADLDLALELARERGASSQLALTHLCYGIYAHLIGDADLERIHGWQALEIADRTKDLFARAHGLFILGEGHLRRGRWEEAIEALQESLDTSRQPEMNLHIEPGALGLLAEAYLGQGKRELALATAEQAVASEGPDLLHALLAMARVLVARGDAESLARAGQVLDEAAAFVQSSGASSWEPLILLERAALAATRGEADAQKTQLDRALELFDGIGATHHAGHLRRQLSPES